MWISRVPDLCQWKSRCPSWTPRPYSPYGLYGQQWVIPEPKLDKVRVRQQWTPRPYSPYGLYGRKATVRLIPEPKLDKVRVLSNVDLIRAQICVSESQGVRPGLPVLMVSVDVKQQWGSSQNQNLIRYRSPAMWISRVPDLCQWKLRCPSWTPRPYSPYGLYGRKATVRLIPEPKLDKVRVPSNVDLIRPQGLCHEGEGVRPGLPVLIFLVVSVDVKQHWSSSQNQNLIRYRSPAMWISSGLQICVSESQGVRPGLPVLMVSMEVKQHWGSSQNQNVIRYVSPAMWISSELQICVSESQGVRPGLPVLMVSMDVKQHWGSSQNQNVIRYVSPAMWISSELQICVSESQGVRPGLPVLMVSMDVKQHWGSSQNQNVIRYVSPAMWISSELQICVSESQGVRPGLPVLMVSMDVKQQWGSSPNQNLIRYVSPAMWISSELQICVGESRGGRSGLVVPNSAYGLCGRKATLKFIPKLILHKVRVPSIVDLIRAPEMCHEGRSGRLSPSITMK